ncbi:TlpA disulfide reductase family protein [Sediminibacterium sp.]|uniref:TlpA family protein disulfide reductase n=1 Tax=Sediminibacterium sp. TaxID=1917865 RepID=UPI0027373758|nr:TlpA disulfide reductase family protein [Sediminibacterium sp.]MDP3394313.1 TlpA disulfide reductase family protein [Sediminibacterium sp.]MDP3568148.1 TlpA disulfide reductase family protein [Sediminibacterium sp.]
MLKLIIFFLILFSNNVFAQNALINGNVHNFTSSSIPFSIQNPVYNFKLYQVLKKPDSSFQIRMSIDKPTIANIAYVPIFIKPNDTVNFSFTFTPTPINEYEYTISVKGLHPGDLLFYDFLRRQLNNLNKLDGIDSVTTQIYIDSIVNQSTHLNNSIDSFIAINPISSAFLTYLNLERDYFLISFLLNELRSRSAFLSKLSLSKLELVINKVQLNQTSLLHSSTYYATFIAEMLEYYLFYNQNLNNEEIFSKRLQWIFDQLIPEVRNLALPMLSRIYTYKGTLNFLERDTAIFSKVMSGISNDSVKTELLGYLNTHLNFNMDSINSIKFMNTNENVIKLGDILKSSKKMLLVDFWASWCGPCITELPFIKLLKDSIPNLRVLSLSIDSDKNSWLRKLKELNKKIKDEFCVLDNKQSDKLARFLKIETIPRYLLVDATGKIRHFWAERPRNLNQLIYQIRLLK